MKYSAAVVEVAVVVVVLVVQCTLHMSCLFSNLPHYETARC